MAKSPFPMKTGSGILPKLIVTLVVIAILTMVVKNPAGTAAWVTGLAHATGAAIDGLSSFLQHIIG
jgi:hypothetical protein